MKRDISYPPKTHPHYLSMMFFPLYLLLFFLVKTITSSRVFILKMWIFKSAVIEGKD